MANEAKKFVRIQSTKTIAVTPGLQNKCLSDKKNPVKDDYKIQPFWQQATVLIKEGTHYYPAEIVGWNTVKVLVEKEILTIGEIVSKVPDSLEKEANETSVKYEKGKAVMDKNMPQKKLADI